MRTSISGGTRSLSRCPLSTLRVTLSRGPTSQPSSVPALLVSPTTRRGLMLDLDRLVTLLAPNGSHRPVRAVDGLVRLL